MSAHDIKESAHDYVSAKMSAKAIDRIVGQPTIVTYGILEDQLAVMASTVKTTQWGGNHGHLTLVVGTTKYQAITGDATLNADRMAQPDRVDDRINGNSTNFDHLRWTRENDEKIREHNMMNEADDILVQHVVDSVNEQYIDELKKDYVGYSDQTCKTILSHIKSKWCKITTREKTKALAVFRQPWDRVTNITSYERALDKGQEKCVDMGIPAPDAEKVQIYTEQMYLSEIFTEKEMVEWEEKTDATKTWANAKTYFGALYSTRQSYESDMKARGAGFESANSLSDRTRVSSGNSIGGATTGTTGASTSRSSSNKLRPDEWVEYSYSLEDSLAKAKEYAAAISARATTDKAVLLLKQEQAMDQNTKLLALLTSGGHRKDASSPAKDTNNQTRGGGGKRERRLCKNCEKEGYHEDDECFTLEKNATKRPSWYKSKNGE